MTTNLKSIYTGTLNNSQLEIVSNIIIQNILKINLKNIGLTGDLGAGKTALTKNLVKNLGFNDEVSSPTYVLQNIYTNNININNDSQIHINLIEHWDLYRLNSIPQELFENNVSNSIRIIEWADKFEEVLQNLDLTVNISILDKEFRKFEIFIL